MAGRDVLLCAEANDSQDGRDKKRYSCAPRKMTMSKHYLVHPRFEYVSVEFVQWFGKSLYPANDLVMNTGDEGEPGLYV